MGQVFEANDASSVWESACRLLIESGKAQASRVGPTSELLHTMFVIHDPRQRWVLNRRVPINPAFAIAEVVWILSGRNDSAFLNHWNSQLPKYAGASDTYYGAYGFRLRQHFGLDQLERAYHALANNPNTRQIVLQVWDAQVDLPDEQGNPRSSDIPCNILSLVKIRDHKLEWMQVMRSNDLFRGTPYNFIQWTSIQEVLAGWLDVELGTYTHLSDSLHIYEAEIDQAYPPRSVEIARNNDFLHVNKADFDTVIAEMSERISGMAKVDLTVSRLQSLAETSGLPGGFHNMLLVVGAEAARRHRWIDEAQKLMAINTNPVLQQAWLQWSARFDEPVKNSH